MGSKFAGLGIEVDKPQRMTITHPATGQVLADSNGKAAYIDLYSADSERGRAHARRVSRRRLNSANQRGRVRVTPEQIEADQIDLLTALTAGWHLVALDGTALDVDYSEEAARELYADPAVGWLVEQADTFAADRENFSKTSPKS